MTAQPQDRSLRIGEVAEQVGVTTRTIRYYEELGLLGTDAARMKGAQRLYGEGDIARLQELIRLRDLLGLSLEKVVALAEAEEARAALRDQWADSLSDAERARIGFITPSWVGFVAALAPFAWLSRIPRTLAPLLLGSCVCFGLFYVLGRQAFCNYYYLLDATVLFAAATLAK